MQLRLEAIWISGIAYFDELVSASLLLRIPVRARALTERRRAVMTLFVFAALLANVVLMEHGERN